MTSRKKVYGALRLTVYGSIEKITLGSGVGNANPNPATQILAMCVILATQPFVVNLSLVGLGGSEPRRSHLCRRGATRAHRGVVFSCVTYGMSIRCVLPLSELVTGKGAANVVIRLSSMNFSPPEVAGQDYLCPNAEETYLFREDMGTILVRKGREIVIDPTPGVKDQVLRLFVLGPALAVLLHQRGRLVLHASAGAIAGEVVAFMGRSGWGKSTTAAALYVRGHSGVADNVTAVQVNTDTGLPVVFPGFPQLKLWPEGAASPGDVPEVPPRLDPRRGKRGRRVTHEFSPALLPLRRIYVLDEEEPHEIKPPQPQDALIELVSYSCCARLLQSMGASSRFPWCANIVDDVTVGSLGKHRSLSALSDLAQLVEGDLAQRLEQGGFSAS